MAATPASCMKTHVYLPDCVKATIMCLEASGGFRGVRGVQMHPPLAMVMPVVRKGRGKRGMRRRRKVILLTRG